jgi:branched-chain amino acid transport system substrate-binding protein
MAVVFFTFPAQKAEAAKLDGRNVKIGCLIPTTGKGAEWGEAGKIGMEIAVEEINAKGGIGGVPIDLICYDTQTAEAEALKTVSRLVDRDKVLAVSGPCFSGEFETIAPQLDTRLKTIIDSYCSSKPGLSKMSKWAFRNTLTSDKQLKPVVAAWVKEYKLKKVVIMYDAEDAVSKSEGAGVLPGLLKENNVEVLDSLTYRTKDTDYSAQVTKAKSLGAQGIAFGACYQNAGAIVKEMAKQGLNVPVVAGACTSTQGFIDIAGKAAEGAYMSTAAWIDDPRPAAASFLKKYLAKSGNKQPNYGGPRAYDNIYSFKLCIEKSGVTNKPADLDADRDRIRGCMQNLKGMPGAAGEVSFNADRDGEGQTAILKVVNGKYINILAK